MDPMARFFRRGSGGGEEDPRGPQAWTLPPAARDSVLCDLMERVSAGNESALLTLHRLTGDRLHRVALGIVGDWETAEDVVADTFAQVWKRAETYDAGRGNVLAWLTTIARNRAVDRLRQGKLDATSLGDLTSSLHPPGEDGTPSQDAAGREDASEVRRALRELPSIQRRAIELAFFEGLSHAEVADALGKPLGTVKTRIRAGLAAIRARLGLP
jgi:RNA polymerase sigma-70 factor (ECF subfamily)